MGWNRHLVALAIGGHRAAAIERGRWPTDVRPAAINAHRVLYELLYARDLAQK